MHLKSIMLMVKHAVKTLFRPGRQPADLSHDRADMLFVTQFYSHLFQWDLVCDNAWISPAINSIQVGCMLIGNFLSGHLADTVGRKKPFFMSLLMLIVFNLLSYLSVNWVMYAVVRAFAGVATGIYLTIRYNYQSEFSLSRWRIWLIGFPSWGIEACIMALVLWILKDWRNMHLVIAIVGVPFLATWWYLFIFTLSKQSFNEYLDF